MKLASYIADGRPAFGAVVAEGVITLNERLGAGYPSLREALAASAVAEMKKAAETAQPDHAFAQIQWLPPIPNPEKILCAGINYRAHAAETGRDLPRQPSMFIRLASTLVGHEGELIRPSVSEKLDFEGELAVVIGRPGRHIPVERALDHVAGYTCFVDGSVRDYQQFSVTSGKNFPATGPVGPWIVTCDEIPDPQRLTLITRLNRDVMQKATTDLMIYSVPQIISFCSDFTPLAAGDIIATGTPEGVGHRRNPPVWMKPGDMLEVEISGIGTLRSAVVDERA